MSFYIAIPSNNRQASQEFALLNQNYRRANNIGELRIKATRPLQTFFYIGFLSIIPWLIASAFGLSYQCLQMGPRFNFGNIPQISEPTFIFCIVTAAALPAAFIKKFGLTAKKPGGKFTHGYCSTGKISADEANRIVTAAKTGKDKVTVYPEAGIGGNGLCYTAVKSLRTLGRLVNGFLKSQPRETRLEHISTDQHYGHVNTPIVKTDTDEDEIDFRNGVLSAGEIRIPDQTDFPKVDIIRNPMFPENEVFVLPTTVYESAGHCFPFVPFTIPSDRDFFAGLLYGHFANFFASDAKSAKGLIEQLVDHLPAIGSLYHGSELLFLLFCIHLAISTGGSISVISDGSTFIGVVLHTLQHIWRGDVLVAPVDADSIRKTLATWMTTSRAREIIAETLSKMPVATTKRKAKVAVTDIPDLSSLMTVLTARIQLSSSNSDLDLALKSANYVYEPISASTENITLALNSIFAKTIPEGFVLSPELFTCTDPVLVANLSVFGYKSISFSNAGGKPLPIYAEAIDDPNMSATKDILIQTLVAGKKGAKKFKEEKKSVSYYDRICITRPNIETAVKDFEGFLESRKIHQLTVYDVKAYGNVDVHPLTDGGKSEIILALRQFGAVKDFFPSKKQKADFVEVDEGGSEDESDLDLDF